MVLSWDGSHLLDDTCTAQAEVLGQICQWQSHLQVLCKAQRLAILQSYKRFTASRLKSMAPHPPEHQPLPDMDERFEQARRSVSGRKSVSSLASDIDSELLRAVPMALCLKGFGKHFSADRKSNDYHLSQRVDEIDSFISH